MSPSTRDVFPGPCPFTVSILDVTAMLVVPTFIFELPLVRVSLKLCVELYKFDFSLWEWFLLLVIFDLTKFSR